MTKKLFPEPTPEEKKNVRNAWRLIGAVVGGIMIAIPVMFWWLIVWGIAGDSPSSFVSKLPIITLVLADVLIGLLLLFNYIFKKE